MAEIKLERRSSGLKWLWILLAILLVLLLLWWLWPDDEVEVETVDEPIAVEEVEPMGTLDEPTVAVAALPVAAIVDAPTTWIGRTVNGQARVVEVPTDRGFWLEVDGERLFALIADQPREAPLDINPGMEVDITTATVHDADDLENLRGDELDADTEAILADQEVFLMVEESNFQRWDG